MREKFAKTGLFLKSDKNRPFGTGLVQNSKDMNFFTFNQVNNFVGKFFKEDATKILEIDF